MPFFLFEEKMLNSICTNYVIFAYHDVVDFRDFRLYHQCLIFGETACRTKTRAIKIDHPHNICNTFSTSKY